MPWILCYSIITSSDSFVKLNGPVLDHTQITGKTPKCNARHKPPGLWSTPEHYHWEQQNQVCTASHRCKPACSLDFVLCTGSFLRVSTPEANVLQHTHAVQEAHKLEDMTAGTDTSSAGSTHPLHAPSSSSGNHARLLGHDYRVEPKTPCPKTLVFCSHLVFHPSGEGSRCVPFFLESGQFIGYGG